jgi:hypothetical protein
LTTSAKQISGLYITKAVGGTFTGTTTNGSTAGHQPGAGPDDRQRPVVDRFDPLRNRHRGVADHHGDPVRRHQGRQPYAVGAMRRASRRVTITNSLVAQARVMWPYILSTNP